MKKIIGLLVVLAALVLGAYYVMGLATEKTLKKNLVAINRSNGINVAIEKYERGWFTSHSTLNWKLHIPARQLKNSEGQVVTIPAHDYQIQMPLVIYHGPIIFKHGVKFGFGYAHSTLSLPKEYVDKITDQVTEESVLPTLDMSLYVNYANKTHLYLSLPHFKLIGKEAGNQLVCEGVTSRISASADAQNIDGEMQLAGATLIRHQVKTTVGSVSSDYELHKTALGLYLGKADLSMPSLLIEDADKKQLSAKDFALHSSSDINQGLFDSQFSASLSQLTVNEKHYGPANLEMSLKNLDAQVLAQINNELNKMQGQTVEPQPLIVLLPQLPKLLAKGARFEISKLEFGMPEGAIKGNLLLVLPKGEAGNPFQLMQKVEGHGELHMPVIVVKEFLKAAVKQKLSTTPTVQQAMVQQMQQTEESKAANEKEATKETTAATEPSAPKPLTPEEIEEQAAMQTDQRLTAMVRAGLLVQKDKEYVIEFKLSKGQLSINDQPFNPSMMQF